MFDCTCNTENSLLLNQHNGDDAPQVFHRLEHLDSMEETHANRLMSWVGCKADGVDKTRGIFWLWYLPHAGL